MTTEWIGVLVMYGLTVLLAIPLLHRTNGVMRCCRADDCSKQEWQSDLAGSCQLLQQCVTRKARYLFHMPQSLLEFASSLQHHSCFSSSPQLHYKTGPVQSTPSCKAARALAMQDCGEKGKVPNRTNHRNNVGISRE